MVDPVRPPRIAVIDDDKSARQAMEGLMRAIGYEVSAFPSADQFLVWAGRSEVACIVTDIQMPGRSGLDLQKALAAEGSRTPIIFVTGLPPEDSTRAAIEAASHQVIPKPVNAEALIRGVELTLASCRPPSDQA